MIWHIFKKDFRLLWPFATGVAIVGWLFTIVVYQIDHGANTLGQMGNLLYILHILASAILAATAVQMDALPGVRQDWLVRPIARRDLLLAKLLFVVALVQAPIFLADLIEALADGFPVGQTLGAALLRSLCLLVAFYVPVLAFASITRNFTETIVGVVAAVAVLAGLVQVFNMAYPWHWRLSASGPTGAGWLVQVAMILIAACGGSAILSLQYFRRRTPAARGLTASIGVLCLLTNFPPWQPVFAIEQRLSPDPGAASSVQLEFQPSLGRFNQGARKYEYHGGEERTAVLLPIAISGLAADTILRPDLLVARIVGPDGKVETLNPTRALPLPAGSPTAYHWVFVRDVLYEKLRDTPVRLELDYSLTLLRLHDAHALPSLRGRQTIAGLGRCETSMNRLGTAVQLRCLQAGETPSCATYFLEHVPSGRRNPPLIRCEGDYALFSTQIGPDVLRRPGVNLPFRDASDLWHLPVDGPQLKNSQVVVRTYQPLDHFTRRLVIPNVRLSDWLPM